MKAKNIILGNIFVFLDSPDRAKVRDERHKRLSDPYGR
jgi:hypothetical protein